MVRAKKKTMRHTKQRSAHYKEGTKERRDSRQTGKERERDERGGQHNYKEKHQLNIT